MKISRRKTYIALGMLTAVLAGFIIDNYYFHSESESQSISKNFPFLNAHDTVDYVGKETCKGCHSDIYHSFVETGMGSSFHEAKVEYSAADFNNVQAVYDAKNNYYYYPFWLNNHLYIKEFRLSENKKDTLHSRTEKITHIVGSGQHTNSHFWTDGKHLYQAPLTFYTQQKKWDLPPGYEHFNARFSRKIDIECMSCHTGMPTVSKGSTNIFERLPLGIDCERCHGPGELHVNQKRSGILVDTRKAPDYSIVNPRRLPYQLQVDICQRCHLQGNNVLKPGKQFTDFIPGMHLDSIFTVFMPHTQGDEAFVMAGQAERFQQSACFVKSNNNVNSYNPKLNFTCINCHNPHVSVKNTKIQQFNQTCVGCHSENSGRSKFAACKLHASGGGTGSNCVKCHMPASNTLDIPHVTVHDHKIQRPNLLHSPLLPQPSNLSAQHANGFGNTSGNLHPVNTKNPSLQTQLLAYTSYFEKFEANPQSLKIATQLLDLWQSQNNHQTQTFWEASVYLQFVKRDFSAILGLLEGMGLTPDVNPTEYFSNSTLSFWNSNPIKQINDPWFFYRIANAYKNTQQPAKALPWYTKINQLQPYNTDFNAEYASILLANAQISEAIALLVTEINRQPAHEEANYQLAMAYFAHSEYEKSMRLAKNCIHLNPDRPEFHELLAQLFELQGNTAMQQKHISIALTIRKKKSS